MDSNKSLPEQFADLERFTGRWAIATEVDRNRMRRSSSMEEIRELYETVVPRLADVIGHLNGYDLNEMPAEEQQLLRLAMSVMEITPAVELYRQPDLMHAFDAERVEILVDPPI